MQLIIIDSGSKGNSYILKSRSGEMLIIECGVDVKKIMQALEFNTKKVKGVLITHSHGDHSGSAYHLLMRGFDIYATPGELKAMKLEDYHNAIPVTPGYNQKIGSFLVQAFNVVHETPEPVGYLIKHDECGVVLFLTDTAYSPFVFKGLNNIIVEANYCEAALNGKEINKVYRDHIIEGHMSIQTCLQLLQANDLSAVNNIVLIHLSDNNSNAEDFKRQVQEQTGKNVVIADKGMCIEFNKTAF